MFPNELAEESRRCCCAVISGPYSSLPSGPAHWLPYVARPFWFSDVGLSPGQTFYDHRSSSAGPNRRENGCCSRLGWFRVEDSPPLVRVQQIRKSAPPGGTAIRHTQCQPVWPVLMDSSRSDLGGPYPVARRRPANQLIDIGEIPPSLAERQRVLSLAAAVRLENGGCEEKPTADSTAVPQTPKFRSRWPGTQKSHFLSLQTQNFPGFYRTPLPSFFSFIKCLFEGFKPFNETTRPASLRPAWNTKAAH